MKYVPTIAVYADGSSTIDLYEKLDAFKWVERFVMNRRQNMIRHAENNRRLVQHSEMKKKIQFHMMKMILCLMKKKINQ